MTSAPEPLYILGAGMHPWGKWGSDFTEYGVAAARAALREASLDWRQIQLVAGAYDPPRVHDALDAVVVGEQRHGGQLHLHADLQVGRQRALDHLAQHDQTLAGQLHRGHGERLERIRRGVRRRWRVAVFGVAPQRSPRRQRNRRQRVVGAGRIGAVVLARREDVRPALGALAADQVRDAGVIGGEPTVDRRFLAGDLWHRASVPRESTKLKRVSVPPGRVTRRNGCLECEP